MPAPDYETLYAIEEAVEPQFVDIIRDATSLAANRVVRWLDDGEVSETPRIEVEIQTGVPVTKKKVGSYLRHAAWECVLLVRVITQEEDDSAATHLNLVKQVRSKIADWESLSELLITGLPYHAIPKLVWNGTSNDRDVEARERITELTHDIVVEIRSDAWPA